MNKKGFTLVELLAVIAIIAVVALLAMPNIMGMINNGKDTQYVSSAKQFISQATRMYKMEQYKELFENGNKIYLKNIEDINEPEDPYGNKFDLNKSYVIFTQEVSNGIIESKAAIYLESCDSEGNCHYIKDENGNPVLKEELNSESVK